MTHDEKDCRFMRRALQLAVLGKGHVEPNPMVGCVIVRDSQVVGEGWHRYFGGPHAEVEALAAAGETARGSDAYVTLEPCCHHGKTSPCTLALIEAQVARVVIGCRDVDPQVSGGGVRALDVSGLKVVESVLAHEAADLIAPFEKLVTQKQPWVIAKWAMTLDGKLASHAGNSQWISNSASREVVHRLRGRVDAVLVGRGTITSDDPLLTARPPGPRTAVRVVLDSNASLSPSSKIAQSVNQAPVLLAVSEQSSVDRRKRLTRLGIEVLVLPGQSLQTRMSALLDELGRRQMTNLLVEGGGVVFGTLHDMQALDEVHAFVATKIIGGESASSVIAGAGIANMGNAIELRDSTVEVLGGDVYIQGRVQTS